MFIFRLIFQTAGLALGQVRANKFRAALTALGIIIGVGSVTAVIAGLTGMKKFVLKEFETIGTKYVYIDGEVPDSMENKISWREVQLKLEEVEAIRDRCPSIAKITPTWRCNVEVRQGERVLPNVRAMGIWPSWHEIETRSVLKGREFATIDDEQRRYVCLINEKAIEELDLAAEPVGDYLFVGGRRFLIVGVVETKTVSPMFGGGDARTELYMPFATARKLNPNGWLNDARALAVSTDKAAEAASEVEFVLAKMRNIKPGEEPTFFTRVLQSFIDQFNSVATMITAVAGGVVSVSLLVGGVGIMNIMLVSVSERTREIGLRKAVGARPSVILTQFLVEAIVLCTAGGLIGLLVGQGLALALQAGAKLEHAEVPMWAMALALSFSAAVGVIFGMFPAIKASRLDPIEALRHE